MKGYEYLKNKLNSKKARVNARYRYYEMKNEVNYISKLIPSEYGWLSHALGWCGKAVDSIADRLTVSEFREDNFYMDEIYRLNNADVLFDSAILSALITSCSFIYISEFEGYPSLQVIDGGHATGIIDETTGLLREGYAVLEYDSDDNVLLDAYFEAGQTTFYPAEGEPYIVENSALYPLLVPIIYRPDAKRPFGHSRISRACMSLQQGALRTLKRSEIGAEFYAIPQKYVLGLSEEAEFNGKIANYSKFLRFDKDDDGDRPTVGQFQQQTMTPHIEELKMFASLFSGETGLTLDDLGFASVNPSSAEAIKACHENLRLTARKAQRTFATGFINAGYLAASIRDNKPYQRKEIYKTNLAWMPIFENDMSALGTTGDAILKLQQAVPNYMTEEKIRDLVGF